MKDKHFRFLCLTFFTLTTLGCSTTRFAKTGSCLTTALGESQGTFILTPNESPCTDWIEIGQFEHFEDSNWKWENMITKIQKKARENGANIIKIDKYYEGSRTKGHAALISGKFYYADAKEPLIEEYITKERQKELVNCNCSLLKVFRDEGSALLRIPFKMNLIVNDSLIGPLPNMKAYTVKLTRKGEVLISGGRFSQSIINNELGNIYYIKATQYIDTANGVGKIGLTVGAKEFYIIEGLKGKTQFETIETN